VRRHPAKHRAGKWAANYRARYGHRARALQNLAGTPTPQSKAYTPRKA